MIFLHLCHHRSFDIGLGSGSDYLGFDQLVGSSNVDLRYTYNYVAQGKVDSYPLYHTSYEVFSTMEKFVDPDFSVIFSRATHAISVPEDD